MTPSVAALLPIATVSNETNITDTSILQENTPAALFAAGKAQKFND
jgi:hypothetical protein